MNATENTHGDAAMKLTAKESAVIIGISKSDFFAENGPETDAIFTWDIRCEYTATPSMGGIINSLNKKGLTVSDNFGTNEQVIRLTDLGVQALHDLHHEAALADNAAFDLIYNKTDEEKAKLNTLHEQAVKEHAEEQAQETAKEEETTSKERTYHADRVTRISDNHYTARMEHDALVQAIQVTSGEMQTIQGAYDKDWVQKLVDLTADLQRANHRLLLLDQDLTDARETLHSLKE